jgi:heme-degrading monooxygenase HmoA
MEVFGTVENLAAHGYLVWLNSHLGPVTFDGKQFEETKAFGQVRDRLIGIVRIKQRAGTSQILHLKAVGEMMRRHLTYKEAFATPEIWLWDRERLAEARREVNSQLRAIFGSEEPLIVCHRAVGAGGFTFRSAPMISRQWRGLAKPDCSQAYADHLRGETFPAIRKLPGFLRASILRRTLREGVEYLVVTEWANLEAIRQFAGDNVERAVVPPAVREMMLEYDQVVSHYEIIE